MKQKKVLFLYLGTENLGIEALSAYLKARGHAVELLMDPALFSGFVVYNNALLSRLFDSGSDEKLKASIEKSAPDLIGFSVFTGNYAWALKWAKVCKEIYPSVPIVFGGIHPTALPEEVLSNECVDAVVVGDGEEAAAEIIEGLECGVVPGGIKNTVVKAGGTVVKNSPRPYNRDLDAYPILDKQLFYEKVPGLEECYLTITSRGCPFRCTYCANNILHDVYNFEANHIRRRSVDNVMEELRAVKKRGRAKKIFFCDDVFIFDKKWLEEFSSKYKGLIGLPFWCTAYPTVVDKESVTLLKEAGCWLITMGVQSGSPRVRRDIFKRMETNETILKASTLIQESGVMLGLDNIFGAPSEQEEDLIQSLELYNRIKPDRIHTFWLTIFPETDILKIALRKGSITSDEAEDLKKGRVGQFDFGGTVRSNIKLYLKYEFMYHLLSLFKYNDRMKRFLLNNKCFIPASPIFNKMLIILNAIKGGDTKFFYLVKTLFLKRKVP
jgi:anaerobic magnesium-protoporphyrin IX monomethyl ester cyclase